VSTHFIFWRKGRESGSKPVLREIDFTVKPGETVAIVGPSGGGKTAIFYPQFLPSGHLILSCYYKQKSFSL